MARRSRSFQPLAGPGGDPSMSSIVTVWLFGIALLAFAAGIAWREILALLRSAALALGRFAAAVTVALLLAPVALLLLAAIPVGLAAWVIGDAAWGVVRAVVWLDDWRPRPQQTPHLA